MDGDSQLYFGSFPQRGDSPTVTTATVFFPIDGTNMIAMVNNTNSMVVRTPFLEEKGQAFYPLGIYKYMADAHFALDTAMSELALLEKTYPVKTSVDI